MLGKLMTLDEILLHFDDAIKKVEDARQANEGKVKEETPMPPQPAKSTTEIDTSKKRKRNVILLKSYKSRSAQNLLVKIAEYLKKRSSNKSSFQVLPSKFNVPTKSKWPEEYRGETISLDGFRGAKEKKQIFPETEEKLKKLKFVWDMEQYEWEMNTWALRIYKVCHFDLDIDPSFRIPDKDVSYPQELWNYPLGQWFANVKRNIRQLPEEKKRLLGEVGVSWIE